MIRRFIAFHPAIIFSYYLGAIALVMSFMHPVFLLLILVNLIILHLLYDRGKSLKKWFVFMITTSLLIFCLNPLFNERGRHVLVEILGHRITLEATIYGGMSALSILGVMMIFVSYNEVMTPNKLLYLFSKFLPQFAILLMLTLRFIPLMRRRLEEISAIQRSKGITTKQGPWRERIKRGMLYVQILLTYSLEEAVQTADSMKARGYGKNKRTAYDYFHFKKSDSYAIIYLSLLFIIVLFGRTSGYGFLTIYPVMETMSLQPIELVLLIFNIMFISFPLLVEIGEFAKWRLSS